MSYDEKVWLDWVIEDEKEVFKILKKCYDVGLRSFDTADIYSNGVSELVLGKFLKHYNIPRDKIVILTKCFFPITPGKSFGFVEEAGYEFDILGVYPESTFLMLFRVRLKDLALISTYYRPIG